MKMSITGIGLALALGVGAGGGYLWAQAQEGATPVGESLPAMFEPGLYHKQLDALEGTWKIEGQIWSAALGKNVPLQATVTYRWVLGRRFLQGTLSGTGESSTFAGLHYLGYDNFRQVYISNWMNNVTTSFLESIGDFDPADQKLTMRGLFDDVRQGAKDVPFWTVTTLGDSSLSFEMNITPEDEDEPKRLMQFKGTRVKEPAPS